MTNQPPISVWILNLEGICRGFLGKDLYKPKAIVLEVEQESMTIKLAKALRPFVRRYVHLGDPIRCLGQSKIDFDSGVIKLKANQIFSVPLHPLEQPRRILPPEVITPTPHYHQPNSEVLSNSLPPPLAKILICKKSGCQKRGGGYLVRALEQMLQTRQLQERVVIQYTGCQKRCSQAPSFTIMPGKHRYGHVSLENLPAIINEHLCSPELRSVTDHADG